MLEALAARQGKTLDAIFVDVPQELLEKRITGRRNCPVCGEIYNIYFKPPKIDSVCDRHPEAQLIHRADDHPDKVRVRLETYARETAPLLEYYELTGRLHRMDGRQAPEEVYSAIERIANDGSVAVA